MKLRINLVKLSKKINKSMKIGRDKPFTHFPTVSVWL